jgi:hypothetical protein
MSALGQKQTFAVQKGMSALTPKADILRLLATSSVGVGNRSVQAIAHPPSQTNDGEQQLRWQKLK